MVAAILEIISGILKAIPVIGKWLEPNIEKNVQKKRKTAREEMDDFKSSGRPPE